MNRRIAGCKLTLAVWPILFVLFLPSLMRGAGLELGSAKVEITPPVGYPMAGYAARKEGSTRVHDPLFARVVVVKSPQTSLALVSFDLIEFPSQRVITAAREQYGVEHVLLSATHTHGGPRVLSWEDDEPSGIDKIWPTAEHSWFEAAEDKVLRAIGEASQNIEPARLMVGRGAADLGYNRRFVDADGSVKMLWQNPARLPTHPVDPRVGVLAFLDARGDVRAVIVNYACHAVVLGQDNREISADYPGVMCEYVEKHFGGNAICLFVQGASGDINPLEATVPVKEGGFDAVRRTGLALGRNVVQVVGQLRNQEGLEGKIQVVHDVMDFPHRWKAGEKVRVGMDTIVFGKDLAIVAMPGEPFVELQMSLAAHSVINNTFLFGYTFTGDGLWADYIPTIRAAAEGGYGAGYNTFIAVGAGEAMVNQALIRIYTALGMLRDEPVVKGN